MLAGAVAGIVVGTTLGAGLTALIGWVAYREYQKRRLKRFYKYVAAACWDSMLVL